MMEHRVWWWSTTPRLNALVDGETFEVFKQHRRQLAAEEDVDIQSWGEYLRLLAKQLKNHRTTR